MSKICISAKGSLESKRKRIRKQHKDRIFCDLFSDKENAMSLFNAVGGTHYTDIDNLQIVTLTDAIYITRKNDVAVCFHDCLRLWEHQSSYNPNMPLRGFIYFAEEYGKWLSENHMDKKIYGNKLVRIPTPEYYVLYNGLRDQPEREELKLSDAFESPSPGYEWTAKVLNVNAGYNADIMERCPKLREYALFVGMIRRNQAEGADLEDAVEEAIETCIRNNILREYLECHRTEVAKMVFLSGITEEEYLQVLREEAEEDAREEGRQQGLQEGRTEGLQQGRTEGLQQGRTEGLQQGRTEGLQQAVSIIKLHSRGLQEAEIAEKLGLEPKFVAQTIRSYNEI